MSLNKRVIISISALILSSTAYANNIQPLDCPPNVTVTHDTGSIENLFFLADDNETLITRKNAQVKLKGFGYYGKLEDSVVELAPKKAEENYSVYDFGADEQVLFACYYEGGAILFQELPVGSQKSCMIQNNLKENRSAGCMN